MGSATNLLAKCAGPGLLCLVLAGSTLRADELTQREKAERWLNYYAAMYDVPSDLVHAIVEVESGWHPDAVSSKGAVGLMQLMPAIAVTFGVANRFVAQENIRGGIAYLARLMKVFHGDLRLVTAAYLAGEDRILATGLKFSNAAVFQYVTKVALLYRQIRLKRIEAEGGNFP